MQAVQRTLDRHPLLKIEQRQVDVSRALLRQATSQFDQTVAWSLTQEHSNTPLTSLQHLQAADAGINAVTQGQNLTTATVSSPKLFRSGVEITPAWQVLRTTDNLLSRPGLNQSNLSVQVVLPLTRGRGRTVVAARESSARIDVDASVYDASQTASELILNTTVAYWNYVAAEKAFDILKGSETRGQTIAENVRTLVEADRLPRSEVTLTDANLAARITNRIAAAQSVIEARQALGVAMGTPVEEMDDIPAPSDDFADPSQLLLPSVTTPSLQRYIHEALARRADYLAAVRRKDSLQVLAVAAMNQVQPQWDVVMAAGYASLREGTRPDRLLTSPFSRVGGPDLTGGIRYSFPLKNNLAKGQLEQARASVDQAALRATDLSRNIASGVIASAHAVANGVLRLQNARATVVAFQTALQGEQEKLRLGIGSLVDILTVEDRLTNALAGEIDAVLAYATAVIRFRFASGSILAPGQIVQSIDRDVLVSPPFADAARNQENRP